MTEVFVPWGSAEGAYRLRERDPLGLLQYPTEATIRGFEGANELLPSLGTLLEDSPAVILLGLPGTGKTFHSLLCAAAWERYSSGLFAPMRCAFYGVAASLDVRRVIDGQWEMPGLIRSECLWVVDDAHNQGTSSAAGLLRYFEAERLSDVGHRLLFVAWAQADELKALPVVRTSLSPQVIALALTADRLQVPAATVLENLANEPALGLQEILGAAKYHPDLLTAPHHLQARWIASWLQHLPPRAGALASDLARLRFLGVSRPSGANPEDWPALRALASVGLANQAVAGHWELADDALARALLRLGWSNLDDSLYAPLRLTVAQFPELAWPVMNGMRTLRGSDLDSWLGRSTPGYGNSRLLPEFLHTSWPEIRTALAMQGRASIVDTTRALVIAKEHLPQEVTDLSRQLLADTRTHPGGGRASADPVIWRATSALSRLAALEYPDLRESLRSALFEDGFVTRLRDMAPVDRGPILAEILRFEPDVYHRMRRALLPSDGVQLAAQLSGLSSSALWKTLDRVVEVDCGLAVDALERLDETQIASAATRDPRLCVTLVASFDKALPQYQSRILSILKQAVSRGAPSREDAASWTSPRDVVHLVILARRIECLGFLLSQPASDAVKRLASQAGPAVVVDLCRTLWKWRAAKPLRELTAKALSDRVDKASTKEQSSLLYGLMLVDVGAASLRFERVLKTLLLEPGSLEGQNPFWLLFNSLTALDKRRRHLIQDVARIVVRQWKSDAVTTPFEVALAGLVQFLLGQQHLVSLALPETDAAAIQERASSPAVTATQLYAAAGTDLGETRQQWLRGLIAAMVDPSKEFKSKWHRLRPRARRTLLQIMEQAVVSLRVEPSLADFAEILNSASAAPHLDDVWDENVVIRLGLAISSRNPVLARELLARRVTEWAEMIGKRHLNGETLIRFLYRVVSLSRQQPEARNAADLLLGAAAPCSSQEPIAVQIALTAIQRLFYAEQSGERSNEMRTETILSKDPLVRLLVATVQGSNVSDADVRSLERQLTPPERTCLRSVVKTLEER